MLLCFCSIVHGQISTREEPVSFRTNLQDITKSERTQKIFPPLDMLEIEKENEEDLTKGLSRFAYRYEVNFNLENSGEWIVLSNGERIWRLSIYCPEALSINLLYDKFWIPDGAKFFIYNKERTHSIGAFTSRNNKGTRDNLRGFSTGLVFGDQITLEYYLPIEVQETGVISISHVSHGYKYFGFPEKMQRSNYGNSGPCQVNINCIEGQDYQDKKNAVALIIFFGCIIADGALINNTANDFTPYFWTSENFLSRELMFAGHDVYNAVFYWHYESSGCASLIEPPSFSTSGAIIVASDPVSDYALLLLDENPIDDGVVPYFLGWDRSSNPVNGGVSIHHPKGDIKKISTYNITPTTTNCLDFTFPWGCMCGSHYYRSNDFWRINWVQTVNGFSIPEDESQGSPLLNSKGRVIGQLFKYSNCRNYGCDSPAHNHNNYGKFSHSWPGVERWLDPINSGVLVLDGISPCFTNFSNRNVTTNLSIMGCNNLSVENVTITNNAKLKLEASGTITIEGNFEAISGTELEVFNIQ